MNSDTNKQKNSNQLYSSSFKATLKIVFGMSYSHFPLILPSVHRLVAPLIMFRLKRRGYSNCRVDVSGSGLVVYAVR